MIRPLDSDVDGDSLRPAGRHGGDVSSVRRDDLDTASLYHALSCKHLRGIALDLGCGIGLHGLRLAAVGFKTILIDRIPVEMTVMKLAGIEQFLPITYLMKDARALTVADFIEEITLCYSLRFIHYLRFDEAVSLLCTIRSRMRDDARLFLSASGLRSELGVGYVANEQPLAQRFAPLESTMANKHDIHAPVCLYTLDELATLCEAASFTPERVYSSRFGNVKGIFLPR